MRIIYTSILAILALCSFTHGKIVSGTIDSQENWLFITRFCFKSSDGEFKYEISYPSSVGVQTMLLYFDDPDQWDAVYKSDLSCDTKSNPPYINGKGSNQDIILRPNAPNTHSGCGYTNNNSVIACENGRRFGSARERWWYIVLANCQETQGMKMDYTITMTNGESIWFKHFSADEFYILQVDVGFLIFYLFIFTWSIVCAVQLSKKQFLHTTYKLYMVALVLQVLSLLIMCCQLGVYASSGIENYTAEVFSRVFASASQLIFILMLILMAKGYTITRGKMRPITSVKIAIFMTLFCITYGVVFIYEALFFDPGLVLYTYDSVPGTILVVLQIIAWIWFMYAIYFTLKHYPEKGRFYYPFFIIYTIWYWAVPVIIVVANDCMDLWLREKVVNGVNLGIMALGHIGFIVLTLPVTVNKTFPYHVRTCQIDVMEYAPHEETTDGQQANSDPHYEYITHNTAPNLADLFVTSHTVSEKGSKMDPDPPPYPTDMSPPSYDDL